LGGERRVQKQGRNSLRLYNPDCCGGGFGVEKKFLWRRTEYCQRSRLRDNGIRGEGESKEPDVQRREGNYIIMPRGRLKGVLERGSGEEWTQFGFKSKEGWGQTERKVP